MDRPIVNLCYLLKGYRPNKTVSHIIFILVNLILILLIFHFLSPIISFTKYYPRLSIIL